VITYSFFFLFFFFLIDSGKGYIGGSFPLLIQKEERVGDTKEKQQITEKRVGYLIINLKRKQQCENTNKQ